VRDYTIRPATLADVTGLAEVARHTWEATYAHSVAPHNRQQFLDQAYSHQALGEAIEHEGGWFFVAIWGETLVGFAQYLRRFDGQGELVRIYIHPDHQRRGIGQYFLAIGLAALAAMGITHCYVSVEENNIAARLFYERSGFRLHRAYGHFLGDQIIRLVEYAAPISSLLDSPGLRNIMRKVSSQ
jgi:ribosomal protein S18 acetylase RimI-like enzyme